jgi:hypothetical protein
MENTKGFYKEQEGSLIYAPNTVLHKDFQLYKEQQETYTYPVEGWYWFNTREDAEAFFGIVPEETEE